MARVGRLAGAILAETEGRYFLVGNPKEPCDFVASGFADPGVIDAIRQPFVELHAVGAVTLEDPGLVLSVEGDALPRILAARLLITRNASVSDRLWRLSIDPEGSGDDPRGFVDAAWLVEMPAPVWQIVRDAVLRCL